MKVDKVVLWGLSGTSLVWRSMVMLMTQSQGVQLLGRWKPFRSRRVPQVQLPRTALLSVPSWALPSSLRGNSHNCLFCQRGFNINEFLKLRGQQETLSQRSVKLSQGTHKLGVQMQFIIAPEILVTFIMLSGGNEKICVLAEDWPGTHRKQLDPLKFCKRTTNRKQTQKIV